MKILYFQQHFKTPSQGGIIRSYLLARELIKAGHEVTMVTSHNHDRKEIEIDGIQTIYLNVSYDNTYKFWRRVISFLRYAILSCWESYQIKEIDACYVMTTPLTNGFIGLFNKHLLNRPYFFEVGDLWPLVPIEMGFIRSSILKKMSHWLEKTSYQNAIGNIGLSDPITDHIEKIAPKIKTETIYNISDCDLFCPSVKKIREEFVICYTGTFGLANDLTRIVQIASKIQHLPIRFILIGDGADKPKIGELVAQLDIQNVSIRPPADKKRISKILSEADAMFISFANHESLFTGSPNKLFDGLAAEKLIITNFKGWIGELITKEKCGFYFHHNSADNFIEQIQPFLKNQDLLKSYQKNALQLAKNRFELKLQSQKFISFVENQFSASHS